MFSASARAFAADELNFISNISLNLVIFELSHITLEFEPCNISSFCGTIHFWIREGKKGPKHGRCCTVEMASYETCILVALF